jgi:hypothetical protein
MPDAKSVALFDPAAAGWQRSTEVGFHELVGPIWKRPCGDGDRYAFLTEAKHHNRSGVVQGGMLMTFADRAMSRTCWYANGRQARIGHHAVDEVVYDGRDAVDTAEPLIKVGRILCGHWHRLLLPHSGKVDSMARF